MKRLAMAPVTGSRKARWIRGGIIRSLLYALGLASVLAFPTSMTRTHGATVSARLKSKDKHPRTQSSAHVQQGHAHEHAK